MPAITCPSCFGSTEYKYEKPAFCSKCGKNYVSGFSVEGSRKPSIAKQLRKIPLEQDYIELEDEYDMPPIRREQAKDHWKLKPLQASFDGVEKPRGLKLFDAAAAGGETRPQENKTAEEVLEELRRENGSMKSTPIELPPVERTKELIRPDI